MTPTVAEFRAKAFQRATRRGNWGGLFRGRLSLCFDSGSRSQKIVTELSGSEIVVTMPGTNYRIIYTHMGKGQLVANSFSTAAVDHHVIAARNEAGVSMH
jgi:hypothetical protein